MTTRSEEFTTAGAITFNVPADVSAITVTLCGAGGSGGSRFTFGGVSKPGIAGGGSAESCRKLPLRVTPGGTVAGVVGAGGARAQYTSTKGQDGGATSFGPFIALGGRGGQGNGTIVAGTAGGGFGASPINGSNFNNTAGTNAVPENERWLSGASGGGAHTANSTHGLAGGKCEGQNGGAGGADGTSSGFATGGGSGGGASPYGPGGDGGAYNAAGSDAPAGAYGAGGGGPGGDASSYFAGKGGDGYVLVEWYEGV